jgi:hypothetical protein
VLRMALLPGLDDDLAFTDAGFDLRAAVEELEWLHPDLPGRARAVELGEAPLDMVGACRAAVAGLLVAAVDADLLHEAAVQITAADRLLAAERLPDPLAAHTSSCRHHR